MKRVYILVAIGILELLIGSALIRGAAEPFSTSEEFRISSGGYHHIEFGILGTGRLSGNFSERQGRFVDFFVFDERGYSSFLSSSDLVPPLFMQERANVSFDVNLGGSGQYHLVFGDFKGQEGLQIHLELVLIGLQKGGTFLGAAVLVGGLALIAASLMMSGPSSRRLASVPPSPGVPSNAPSSSPQTASQKPPDDDTRLY